MLPFQSDRELVSVVIPAYNRAHTIRAAIQSVLWQTYGNLELIVVDDCSLDGTREVVAGFSDSRIRFVTLEENGGANRARNIGWREARGRWVAFQDSDDVWHPQKLVVQMEAISRRSGAAGCFSAFVRCGMDYAAKVPSFEINEEQGLAAKILHENFVSTQTLVVSRDVLEETGGFDEALPRFQDWDLAIRLLQQNILCYVPEPLVTVIDSKNSISHDAQKFVDSFRYVYRKYGSLYCSNPEASARVHLHLAVGHSRLREYWCALVEVMKAVRKDRRSLLSVPAVVKRIAMSALRR